MFVSSRSSFMSWPAWVGDLVRVLAVGSSNSWSVLPTAAHPSLTWLLSSWLACALEFFWSWLLGSTFWCCSPPCLASFPPHLPPLSPVHPTGYLPTCMNATGILISAIRTAVSSLRAIASTLEAAISGYEAAAQSAPVPSGISLPSVDLDLEGSLLSSSSAGFPSQGLSVQPRRRGSAYHLCSSCLPSALCFYRGFGGGKVESGSEGVGGGTLG